MKPLPLARILPVIALLGLTQAGLRSQTIVPNPGVSLVVPLNQPESGGMPSGRPHAGGKACTVHRKPSLSAAQRRALARVRAQMQKAARTRDEAAKLEGRRQALRLETAGRYAARARRALAALPERWRRHPAVRQRIEVLHEQLERLR